MPEIDLNYRHAPLISKPAASPPAGLRPKRPSQLRRDLWITTADGTAYSVMVGCGEIYFPAFALALGLGPVAAGLLASLPVLVGAVVQLVTPFAVSRIGSNRLWVIACTSVQSLAFVPLVIWGLLGEATFGQLLIAISVYWASGMAGVPAWNSWMGTLVPVHVRAVYFGQRNRLGQLATLVGFVTAGLVLQAADRNGMSLVAFAGLFVVAGVSRGISTLCLVACGEPPAPESAADLHEATPRRGRPLHHVRRTVAALIASPAGSLMAYLWSVAFAIHFSAPYFTPYMLEDRRFSYFVYMLLIGTGLLAKAAVMPAFGRLCSRIGSVQLLRIGGLTTIPLSALWLGSSQVGYLIVVQIIAGACWASYELAASLLFFDAVHHRERTGIVTIHNLGLAIATLGGAATGGIVLRWLGEDQAAYFAIFGISGILRLATLPLLKRVRHAAPRPHGDS